MNSRERGAQFQEEYPASSMSDPPMNRLFLWDDAPGSHVEHIAEHGLTPEEVESAFDNLET